MIIYSKGSPLSSISEEEIEEAIELVFESIGNKKSILLIPPDITRLHSQAGKLTRYIYELYPQKVKVILPALGTHKPMDASEIEKMFGNIPNTLFKEHNWRADCKEVGEISSEYIENISEGKLDFPIRISFNKSLFENSFDCIISIRQVVPHEVAGMAGFTKNLVVGLGGEENIHKTHFLGAVYGMERIMGRLDSPVRKVIDYAYKNFLSNLYIIHIITVIGIDDDGTMKIRGLFIGDDEECYRKAALLSKEVNITFLEKPLKKVIAYLDPVEYKSTWLGNKSIYRTRMAIADEGELIVLAPGVKMFG
ncbi:MAG: lactate racemase domain-containing protein, partial [Chitinispirillaceae bacterium]|nr:lactate racemase domain-containing protein [Chitinispirillaceae bacterium]